MSVPSQEPVAGNRRGLSFSARLKTRDSYGILLLLIVASVFMTAASFGRIGNLAWILTLGVTLFFALVTSGASRRIWTIAGLLLVAAVVLTLPFASGSRMDRAVVWGATLGLAIAAIAAIVYRVSTHPRVTGETIGAALSIYLLLGIAFSSAYGMVGAIEQGPAFVGADVGNGGDGTDLELTYFSFVTLTTVGYGDLVPATSLMRMLAITEAFTGQLYLVTVVALVVGNVGRERRRVRPSHRDDEDEIDDPAQE
jgi:hypothetical protein